MLLGVASVVWELVGCSVHLPTVAAPNPPQWYLHPESTPQNQGEWFGYGEGETLAIARQSAQRQLAESLRVAIKCQSESIQNYTSVDDRAIHIWNSECQQQLDLELTATQLVRQQQQGGVFYIQLSYLNLPLAERIRRLVDLNAPHSKDPCPPHSPYWQQTPLYGDLSRGGVCVPPLRLGYNPESRLWGLELAQQHLILRQGELLQLFSRSESESEQLTLHPSKADLMLGDLWQLAIEAKAAGYLSLFQIYADGQVVRMLHNQTVQSGESLRYPDPSLYAGLEVQLPEGVDRTLDYYLALITPTPISGEQFAPIQEPQLNQAANNSGLGTLISMVEGHPFATFLLHVQR